MTVRNEQRQGQQKKQIPFGNDRKRGKGRKARARRKARGEAGQETAEMADV